MNSHSTFQSTLAFNCVDNFSSRSKIEYHHHHSVIPVAHDEVATTIPSTGNKICSFVTILPLQRQLSDLTIDDQDLLCEDVLQVAANKYRDNGTHRTGDTNIILTTGRHALLSPVAAVDGISTTFFVPTSVQIIDTFRCSNKLDLSPKQPTRTGSVDNNNNNNNNKLSTIL